MSHANVAIVGAALDAFAQIARGRGKGGGVQTEMPLALLFSVRAGEIREWRVFAREEEALKAAELEA